MIIRLFMVYRCSSQGVQVNRLANMMLHSSAGSASLGGKTQTYWTNGMQQERYSADKVMRMSLTEQMKCEIDEDHAT